MNFQRSESLPAFIQLPHTRSCPEHPGGTKGRAVTERQSPAVRGLCPQIQQPWREPSVESVGCSWIANASGCYQSATGGQPPGPALTKPSPYASARMILIAMWYLPCVFTTDFQPRGHPGIGLTDRPAPEVSLTNVERSHFCQQPEAKIVSLFRPPVPSAGSLHVFT